MVPVRAWAGAALHAFAPMNGFSGPAIKNLTAAYELIARAGLTHVRPPYGIDSVTVGNEEVAVTEEAAHATPFGTLAALQEGCGDRAAARAARRAALRALRDAAAQHRQDHAARARRLHHRLAQCARRSALGRALRLRRLRRAPDPVSRSDRPGRAHRRGVPALRRDARRRGRDGADQQSGAAALDDADGRADRLPRQPHEGQRACDLEADRMVRAEPDRRGAAALPGRVPQGLSGLRAACRLHEHEHRAPREGAQGALRQSGRGRTRQGGADQGVLR